MVESLPNIKNEIEESSIVEIVPLVERKTILIQTPSGPIYTEAGSDGTWLKFDCDCLDALPICKAQCCFLHGIGVEPHEEERLDAYLEWDEGLGMPVMIRDSDGGCVCLERSTRRCRVYDERPTTCRSYHCTRGASNRGWKLSNSVARQSR